MNARTLTVQVPAPFGQLLIAPALPRFLAAHPDLRVVMIEVSQESDHRMREADAAVCIGHVVDAYEVVRHIGVVHPVTCASAECIERTGMPNVPEELAPGSCIAVLEPRTQRPKEWIFRQGGAAHRISPAAPLAFTTPESAVAAAVHGGGYVRVLSVEAERQIAAGLLRPILEDWNDLSWPVVLVHLRSNTAQTDIAVFAEFVADLLPSSEVTSESFNHAPRAELSDASRIIRSRAPAIHQTQVNSGYPRGPSKHVWPV